MPDEKNHDPQLRTLADQVGRLLSTPETRKRLLEGAREYLEEHAQPDLPACDAEGFIRYSSIELLPTEPVPPPHKAALLIAAYNVVCDDGQRVRLFPDRQGEGGEPLPANEAVALDVLSNRVDELPAAELEKFEGFLRIFQAELKVESQADAATALDCGRVDGDEAVKDYCCYGSGFRSVRWKGQLYSFTRLQAIVVGHLWRAYQQGTPDVADNLLMNSVDSKSDRIVDIFRSSKAIGSMIIPGGTRGTHRLSDHRLSDATP